MEELIKRAEQGDAETQLELAKSYHSGEGMEEDQELALYWLKNAALQENVDAQFLLGLSYYHGDGIDMLQIKWQSKQVLHYQKPTIRKMLG